MNSCECETRQPKKKKENVEIKIYIFEEQRRRKESHASTQQTAAKWTNQQNILFAAACTLQNQPNLPKEKDDECMAAATNDALVL